MSVRRKGAIASSSRSVSRTFLACLARTLMPKLILITARIWKALVSRATAAAQYPRRHWSAPPYHREELVAYFRRSHAEVMDDDSQRRLRSKPPAYPRQQNPAMRGCSTQRLC